MNTDSDKNTMLKLYNENMPQLSKDSLFTIA